MNSRRLAIISFGLALVGVTAAYALFFQEKAPRPTISEGGVDHSNMRIESPAFTQNERIPAKFTCDGLGLLPPLLILKTPEEARSLAIVVDDPDAPSGTFTHWTIWNVPPDTTEIHEGEPPVGVQGRTDFGEVGWGGPCPPDGEHRYFFKVYALDATLDLPTGAGVEELDAAMSGHIVDKAGLIGVYERQR
jgi:hypothetical protein